MRNDLIAQAFLQESRHAVDQEFRRIGHCLRQLEDDQIWWRPPEGANSIGNIVLHLCGNLRQWFLSGVGGDEDVRDRPAEFAETIPLPKDALQDRLTDVIYGVNEVLSTLDEGALLETRRIQGFDTSVLSAIYSTITHLEGHALQIAYATRLRLGDKYEDFWKPSTNEQGAE